ncbi:MAG: SAM-dependent methyltransferase [Nitrososphaera sp.]|jgi:cobalt-precorrin-7 (C5)-methyltransferase
MPKRLYAVGVGPGSPDYITDGAKKAIRDSAYVVGYRYTLATIEHLIDRSVQQVVEVTMRDQEGTYQRVFASMKDGQSCAVPFTGDVSFSESEVVDRLLEIFGEDNSELVPGISSVQVAAARAKVPLDKSIVLTFHVTGDIEQKKSLLLQQIRAGMSAVIIPRPWPKDRSRHFMPKQISAFLREGGVDTTKLPVWVFEDLTTDKERAFFGRLDDLESRPDSDEFSDLTVMVIDQAKRQTYLEF